MSDVMRIDFVTGCTDSDGVIVKGTEREICVLYNKTVISMEEVDALIRSGRYEYDDRIIVTTPTQADNLKGR